MPISVHLLASTASTLWIGKVGHRERGNLEESAKQEYWRVGGAEAVTSLSKEGKYFACQLTC